MVWCCPPEHSGGRPKPQVVAARYPQVPGVARLCTGWGSAVGVIASPPEYWGLTPQGILRRPPTSGPLDPEGNILLMGIVEEAEGGAEHTATFCGQVRGHRPPSWAGPPGTCRCRWGLRGPSQPSRRARKFCCASLAACQRVRRSPCATGATADGPWRCALEQGFSHHHEPLR